MPALSGNSCQIITLFPMGVECVVTNAFTPFTNDGAISLTITGGTAPYSISWSNGSTNQTITNLQYGDYTATVVDYYGDFSATTTCTVEFDSFYLQKFENCLNPTIVIYYLANPTQSQYALDEVYTINGQSGCWSRTGIILYSNQTYYNYEPVFVGGPFDTCGECLPTVPVLQNVSGMCLTTNYLGTQTQYQFYSGSTINGYPSWTASTPNQTIYYNTGNTMWMISGWTLNGQPSLQSTISPPIGVWSVLGANRTVVLTLGNCSATISALITTNNPSCVAASNGSIQISNVIGGDPPYTYSLVNSPSSYQISNTFTNLANGIYTVYIQDFDGNISANVVNLQSTTSVTQYTVTLAFVPANGQTTSLLGSSQKLYNWVVSVSPPLPTGKELLFSIIHVTNRTRGVTNITPTINHSITTGTTTGGQFLTSASTITSTTSTTQACNATTTYVQYQTTAQTRTYTAKITGSGTVSGTINSVIGTSNSTFPCTNFGETIDTLSLSNISIVNQNICESVNNSVTPITFTNYRQSVLVNPPSAVTG